MVPHASVARNTLVTALTACADDAVRLRAWEFLSALSSDELQFLAEFVGSCILESPGDTHPAARMLELYQSRFDVSESRHGDRDHKILVLHEYLGRTGAIC